MSTNAGAYMVEYVTADVTSITNGNNEPLSTWTDQSAIDVVAGVTVAGVENADTLTVQYDRLESDVYVVTTSDGSNPPSDVGEITLRLEGRR